MPWEGGRHIPFGRALKGRHKAMSYMPPFQAQGEHAATTLTPGRLPWLSYAAPSGLRNDRQDGCAMKKSRC